MKLLRVLHVDDENDVREIVKLSLELDKELAVKCCSSAQEAWETLAQWRPDVILLDVMMPVMDGPAMLVQLRQSTEFCAIPVVFLTALTQKRDIDFFNSLGADGVIVKPFDVATLADQVRRHLHRQ